MESSQSPEPNADPAIGRVLGGYRFVRKIAQGGMGAVYEGIHTEHNRRVAIKVLLRELLNSPDAAKRFFLEAKAVSMVSHPSLVQILEHGTSPDGDAYIIMEYLDGDSLRQRLEKRYLGGSAIRLMLQLTDALTVTHNKRIVHRDLKPENIMLVADDTAPGGERAKILDFGIAKLLPTGVPEEGQRSFKTSTGTLIGTPTYMSPEQCRASSAEPPDEKTDVYSLGIIFYELVYGEPTFISDSAGELFALQMFAPPPDLKQRVPALAPAVAEQISKLLAKQPAQRPTMAELHAALAALPSSGLTDGPVSARPSAAAAQKRAPGSGQGAAEVILQHLTGQTGNTSHNQGGELAPPARRGLPLLPLAAAGVVALFGLVMTLWLMRPRASQPSSDYTPAARSVEHAATAARDGGSETPAGVTAVAPKEVPPSPPSPPPPAPPLEGKSSKRPRKGSHKTVPQGAPDGNFRIDAWK